MNDKERLDEIINKFYASEKDVLMRTFDSFSLCGAAPYREPALLNPYEGNDYHFNAVMSKDIDWARLGELAEKDKKMASKRASVLYHLASLDRELYKLCRVVSDIEHHMDLAKMGLENNLDDPMQLHKFADIEVRIRDIETLARKRKDALYDWRVKNFTEFRELDEEYQRMDIEEEAYLDDLDDKVEFPKRLKCSKKDRKRIKKLMELLDKGYDYEEEEE